MNKFSVFYKNFPYIKLNCNIILKPENTRENLPTIRYNNVYLESRYYPLKKSREIVEKYNFDNHKLIILIGSGLGYILKVLSDKYKSSYILCIEPDEQIFCNFIYHTPFVELLNNPEIIYLPGKRSSDFPGVIDYILNFLIKSRTKIGIILNQYCNSLNKKIYSFLFNEIMKKISEVYSNYLTENEFGEIWKRNIKQNIKKYFKSSRSLKEYKNKFKEKEAVVIGAGPELEKFIKFLKQKKNENSILIAVDTALKFLAYNRIIPDFVISLDAKFLNFLDFINLPQEIFNNTTLVYDIVVFPAIPEIFKNKVVTYTKKLALSPDGKIVEYTDKPIREVFQNNGYTEGLQSGGTVASNAFVFALYTGCNPVHLTGIDFKIIDFKTHCKGTYKEYFFLQRQNRLFNYHNLIVHSVLSRNPERIIEEDRLIYKDYIYTKYERWFKEAIQISGRKVIWHR